MKKQEIRFKRLNNNYSIIIGENILKILSNKVRKLCPKAKNIALVADKNIPIKFKTILKNNLKNYNLFFYSFNANEKVKSMKTANFYLNQLLINNFNRTDLVISIGGGITGDVIGFVSSVFKRGINFINIPTTLLAQVDSSIGGKTGVNSNLGKNLIGTFYQPKLVIIDTLFLKSLSKKEMICGYAEILKHAIIRDKNFFVWLKKNSNKILSKNAISLIYAIRKSCQIKMFFVEQDENEKASRMILNFGHTFAHAIEIKNKFSKQISHGEAVLSGMILESRLSVIKKTCKLKTLEEIENIYTDNNLSYTYKRYNNKKSITDLLNFLKNDKKNEDEKINFILLKKIGKTTRPNKNKITLSKLKKLSKAIAQN